MHWDQHLLTGWRLGPSMLHKLIDSGILNSPFSSISPFKCLSIIGVIMFLASSTQIQHSKIKHKSVGVHILPVRLPRLTTALRTDEQSGYPRGCLVKFPIMRVEGMVSLHAHSRIRDIIPVASTPYCHWCSIEGGNFGTNWQSIVWRFLLHAKTTMNFVKVHPLNFAMQKYAFFCRFGSY